MKLHEKAKKVSTIYGTYSNLVAYEYRGKFYDVEYPLCSCYCCTSPKVQHSDAQKRIDVELDNPSVAGSFPFDIEAVFNLLGWD